jgi:hypothetical protein
MAILLAALDVLASGKGRVRDGTNASPTVSEASLPGQARTLIRI